MAITILPKEDSLGERLGTGLGSGLAGGIRGFAEQKLQRLQTTPALQALGFDPAQAEQLAGIDPRILQEIVKGKIQEPSQQAFAQALSPFFGGQAPQAPAGVTGAPGAPSPQLKPQQAFQLAQLGLQREAADVKKQTAIETSNRPFTKRLDEKVEPARDLDRIIDRAQELIQDPDIQTGALLGGIPARLQNAETQELAALFNELVTTKTSLMKGVPSKMRITLEQLSKPQIWQKKQTLLNRLNQIKDSVQPTIQQDTIRDQIIEENQGNEPRGLKTLVQKRQKTLDGLPSPQSFSEDSVIESGGQRFSISNGQWVPAGGA